MHTDDVTAMDFDSKNHLFATGQLGPKPSIYIWSNKDMGLVYTLKSGLIKGIECL